MLYRFEIDPQAKPRMTQSDRWKKRPATSEYWAFKTQLRVLALREHLKTLPTVIDSIDFFIPMPQSWSNKKRAEMDGKLHTQRPDIDNYLKGLFDAICDEDSHIAQVGRISKTWADTGKIEIEITQNV